MSQTAIGRAALVLSTDASAAKAGLAQFGHDTTSAVKGIAAQAGSAAAGGGGFLSRILGGLGLAKFAGPVGAVAAAVGGFFAERFGSAFSDGIDRLKVLGGIGKKAATLGISGSQFQGLTQQLARVGIEGDTVTTIFAKLGKTISSGGDFENPAAIETFARLGLDAKELAKLPLDQSFLKIASAIHELPTAAGQANAAIGIFGRQGAALLPVLQKGGAGIQEFIDKQKKFGAVLSDAQLAKATEAAKAWKEGMHEIESAWQGMKNRAVMILAPLVKFIGKAISRILDVAQPVFDWVGRALESVAEIAEWVFEAVGQFVEEAIHWVEQLAADISDWAGQMPSVRDVVVNVFRAIGTAGALVWDTLKAGAGAVAVVFGEVFKILYDIQRALIDLLKAIPKEFRPDWFDSFLSGMEIGTAKGRKFAENVSRWGQDAVTGWGNSAVQFNGWLDRMLARQKKHTGDVKADAMEAAAEVQAAFTKIENPALLKGTQAEVSARLRAEFGAPSKEMLKEQKEANKKLGGIEGGIKKLNDKKAEPLAAF